MQVKTKPVRLKIGYEFDLSLALDGDEFLGLGLDNDNEEELTEERLIIWAELIRDEFVA